MATVQHVDEVSCQTLKEVIVMTDESVRVQTQWQGAIWMISWPRCSDRKRTVTYTVHVTVMITLFYHHATAQNAK